MRSDQLGWIKGVSFFCPVKLSFGVLIVIPEELIIHRDDILKAQKVIDGRVHRTPMSSSSFLSNQLRIQLHFKLELLQKTGSFKPRGVLNKLDAMSEEEKSRGIISLSAGNHAQAVAWGAAQSNISSTLVMPAGSLQSKINATKQYGGQVILTRDNLLETCLNIQKERSLELIHPFDDPKIIAGQGTVGLEILEDVPDVDMVIVGIGGGGLISGIAAALKTAKPEIKVIGVEPEGASAMTESLQKGEPVHLSEVNTIADGLAAPFAGNYTLAHVQKYVDEVVTVSDEDIIDAMKVLLERVKFVAEPAAASTLAVLLSNKVQVKPGSSVICIISGGNIDCERLKGLL